MPKKQVKSLPTPGGIDPTKVVICGQPRPPAKPMSDQQRAAYVESVKREMEKYKREADTAPLAERRIAAAADVEACEAELRHYPEGKSR